MRQRMMWLGWILGVLVLLPADGWADRASPWHAGKTYSEKALGKLTYGAENLLLGWSELVTEPDESIWEGSNVFTGMFRGMWHAVADTVGGAYHLLTFPHVGWDLPLPEGGVGWKRIDPTFR